MVWEIDTSRTALVIIDLQKGIASVERKLGPYDAKAVIENAAKIAGTFRQKKGFVVPVHVFSRDGMDMLRPIADQQMPARSVDPSWGEFVPELRVGGDDHVINKHQWGAFFGTDLDLQLRRRGINTIVLCGISTNIGVETTAREAYQHGYNQIFAEDAMAASSAEEHANTVKYIFPRIGLVRKTQEILEAINTVG